MTEYTLMPYWDHNRHTCLELQRTDKQVRFVLLDVTQPLHILTWKTADFNAVYKPIMGYDRQKAYNHFRRIAKQYGAVKELRIVLNLMNCEDAPKAEVPPTFDVAQRFEQEIPAGTVKIGQPVKVKKPGPTQVLTAAARFKELIMAGKLTDDEIFLTVKTEFGLDDGKRKHVNWYRWDLKRKGFNPPTSIKGEK